MTASVIVISGMLVVVPIVLILTFCVGYTLSQLGGMQKVGALARMFMSWLREGIR